MKCFCSVWLNCIYTILDYTLTTYHIITYITPYTLTIEPHIVMYFLMGFS